MMLSMRPFVFLAVLLTLLVIAVPHVQGSAMRQVTPVQVEPFTVQGLTNMSQELTGSQNDVVFDGVEFNIYWMLYWTDLYTVTGGYVPGYVAYLVNATANDFQVAFLYLRNGYTSFDMYLYDYNVGYPQSYHFTGQATVSSAQVSTYPSPSGTPAFVPQPKFANQVSLQGTDVSVHGNSGQYGGQQVDVLWNYLYVTNAWHEVWTITSDYHFVIFYAYLNQPNSITVDDLNLATDQLTVSVQQGTWSIIQPTPLTPPPPEPVPEFNVTALTLLTAFMAAGCAQVFYSKASILMVHRWFRKNFGDSPQ